MLPFPQESSVAPYRIVELLCQHVHTLYLLSLPCSLTVMPDSLFLHLRILIVLCSAHAAPLAHLPSSMETPVIPPP